MAATASMQPFMYQQSQIDPQALINKKLADRNAVLTLEQRISLLVGCIKLGEEGVAKVEKETAAYPIVFLGNTGSGKSTMINYLAGCEMKCIDPREVNRSAPSDIVIVKSDSPQQAIMKIGHSKISQTFIPDIASAGERVYCDCPGFVDNRGVEINIANIVNTRGVLLASKGVRLVVLIEYGSLFSNRADGLRGTINIAKQFFGKEEIFHAHRHSILLGVTKVPERTRSQNEPRPLQGIKDWIIGKEGEKLDSFERAIVRTFADQLFIYDPIDRVEDLLFSGGKCREELLHTLDHTPHITPTKNIFNVVLTAEDEVGLREICEGMAQKIQESLAHKLYGDANLLLEYTYKLKQVEHPHVEHLVEICRKTITTHFTTLVQEIDQELSANAQDLTPKARELFHIISTGISTFGEQDIPYFEEQIGLNALKRRYATHQRRIEYFENESRLKALVTQFRDKCFSFDLEVAKGLLEEIKAKVIEVNHRFQEENLYSEIDTALLERQLEQAHKMKEKIELTEQQLAEQQREYNKNLEEMEKAMAADKQKHQEKLDSNQKEMQDLRGQVTSLQSANARLSSESSVSSSGGGGCTIL